MTNLSRRWRNGYEANLWRGRCYSVSAASVHCDRFIHSFYYIRSADIHIITLCCVISMASGHYELNVTIYVIAEIYLRVTIVDPTCETYYITNLCW